MWLLEFVMVTTTCFTLCKSNTYGGSANVKLKSIDCDFPNYVMNGALEISSVRNSLNKLSNGTEIRYSCQQGYKLDPAESFRYCINGSWTNTNPSCIPLSDVICARPDTIPNGFYQPSPPEQAERSFRVGNKIEYSCKHDYTLMGPSVLTCDSNGEWHPKKTPFCTPTFKETEQLQACSPPPKVPNTLWTLIRGKQRANDALPGATFEVNCNSGYRDSKNPCVASIIRCDNGSWKGSVPSCVKVETCFPPPDISHGSIISPMFEASYPISYEVMYTCDAGYVTFPKNFAQLTLRCEENGCWAPNALPTCHPESSLFYGLRNNYDDYFHLTTGGLLMCILFAIFGITSIMVAICSLSMCRQRYLYLRHRRRTARSESRPIPNPVAAASPFIRPNTYGRTAFIAFADGIQVEQQHHLPTYDEVLRQDRSGPNNTAANECITSGTHFEGTYSCAVSNCDIPMANGSGLNNTNDGINNDSGSGTNQRNVRFSSQPSESIRYRSGLLQNHASNRDMMGSTDTMAISEVSANTLDNVSAHTIGSVSQNPSCRAMCGSLASFDACSVITEGFPLLEEYETENENQSGGANIHIRSASGNK